MRAGRRNSISECDAERIIAARASYLHDLESVGRISYIRSVYRSG